MKQKYGLVLMFVLIFFGFAVNPASGQTGEEFELLPGPGKKCPINEEYYFKYSFDKKPTMGTVILKISVYDKNDRQSSDFKIVGDSGMPSMHHHDTGDVPFVQNKKGDYLLPVDLVMPGEWEIRITFMKKDNPVYKGAIRFDV